MQTPLQLKAGALLVIAVGDTIRDFGVDGVPSGHLYAALMANVSFEGYMRVIDTLKRAGLVAEAPSHLLTWVGPKVTQ